MKKGQEHTKKTRDLLSKFNKGKKLSDETKRKISIGMKGKNTWCFGNKNRLGKKFSIETKIRMSKTRKGKKLSGETKMKISRALNGLRRSDETRLRMSAARKGIKLSQEHRLKISKNSAKYFLGKTGKKHPGWRGGKSFEPYSVDWTKTLKISIRERDRYVCQMPRCGQRQAEETLLVHHIDYDKKNCDPKNLLTLCRSCHSKTNFNREKWTNYFNNLIK